MKRSRMVAGFLSGLLMLGATTAGSAGGIHETDGYLLQDKMERLVTSETDPEWVYSHTGVNWIINCLMHAT